MGVEIEAKMRLHDIQALEDHLLAIGGTLDREVMELNTYFDTVDHALRSSDQGLCIRIETVLRSEDPATAIMTYKGPRAAGALKRRSELEMVVDPAASAIKMIEALGFYRVRQFEKLRRHWHVDPCVVDVDTMPYLGHFVEIEGPSEQAVLDLRHRLGLDQQPLVQASYIGMLETYLRQHHIDDGMIRLDRQPPSR